MPSMGYLRIDCPFVSNHNLCLDQLYVNRSKKNGAKAPFFILAKTITGKLQRCQS
jgi:hypothetical protein